MSITNRKGFKPEHPFAVLIFTQRSEPGYDPGEHSYKVDCIEYESFPNEVELKAWIERATRINGWDRPKDFQILKVQPISFKTDIKISLE